MPPCSWPASLSALAAFLALRGTQQRVVWQLRFLADAAAVPAHRSFAPSPLFDQYFYPLVPFVVLAALYAIASIPPGTVLVSANPADGGCRGLALGRHGCGRLRGTEPFPEGISWPAPSSGRSPGSPSSACSPARTPRCRSSCTTGRARPQEGFRADAAAAIVALLVITLFANAIAIYFRNRYEQTW